MSHRFATAALLALSLGTLAVPARAEDGTVTVMGLTFQQAPDARDGVAAPVAPRTYDTLTTGSVSAPVRAEGRPEASENYYQSLRTGTARGLNR